MVDHNNSGTTVSTIRNLYGATNAAASLALQSGIITLGTGTSYTERMRIDASGNLLVGKTASSFTTAGVELAQGGTAGKVQIQRSSSPLALSNLTDDGSILSFYKGTTVVGSIGTQSDDLVIYSTTAGHAGIRFANGTFLPTDNSGVLAPNSVDIGSATNTFKDLYLAGGINLNTASTNPTILMARSTTGNNNMTKYSTGGTDQWIVGQRNDGTSNFRFYSYATASDVVSIDTSGNLLVGQTTTNNPAGANVAGAAIANNGFISVTRDGDFSANFNRKTSDGTIVPV
jgi:hypothetical protein